jgi:predicted acylesterase/phospholipase RssA
MDQSTPRPSLVLSGGIALGSYQAGVYEPSTIDPVRR